MSSPVPFDDIKAKLEAADLGVPIAWPNTSFKKPNPPAPWLAVGVTSNVMQPIELGGHVWQEEGTAYIDVMVPANSGSSTARTLAKAVSNVFRGLGPEAVVYLGGSIGNGVVSDPDGNWWTITVSVDWKYQDTTE